MTFNPIQSIDKTLVAKRFAHARNTYGREARVQQQVAEKMLRLLMEHTGKHSAAPNSTGNTLSCPESISPFRKVAEFGCGTGCYSRLLLHTLQPESLLLNDLCPEMEECIKDICDRDNKGRVKFMPCDAETLEFPQETDLITSCSPCNGLPTRSGSSPVATASCRTVVSLPSALLANRICRKYTP